MGVRWLLVCAALVLGAARGQEAPVPPPEGQPAVEEVEEGAFLKLLENHPKGLWAFFPALEDEKVAEALRRRAMKGRPLVLLFPEAEVHNPVSYSNTFFLGQLVWRNVRVKHLSLKTTGEEPIYILEGVGVFVGRRKVPEKEAGTYIAWWQQAWRGGKSYDPLRFARDIYLEPRRARGRQD